MWDVEMAKMFKERNQKDKIGPIIGNVSSVSPLKVSILGGDVVLQAEQLYISRSLLDKEYDCKINTGSTSDIKLYFSLKKDDEVLLVPTEDEQTYFIIDIVEKAGG